MGLRRRVLFKGLFFLQQRQQTEIQQGVALDIGCVSLPRFFLGRQPLPTLKLLCTPMKRHSNIEQHEDVALKLLSLVTFAPGCHAEVSVRSGELDHSVLL